MRTSRGRPTPRTSSPHGRFVAGGDILTADLEDDREQLLAMRGQHVVPQTRVMWPETEQHRQRRRWPRGGHGRAVPTFTCAIYFTRCNGLPPL